MKKLFVSVPMKGRTEEEIRASILKMKGVAEACEGEELELIQSYIEDNPPKDSNEAVFYLGKSIQLLSTADVFIGVCDAWDWNGCAIERDVASRYGIKSYEIDPRFVIDQYEVLKRKVFQNRYNATSMLSGCMPVDKV